MPLRYLTAGESHGPGLTAILEGIPSHVPVLKSDIDKQLARRQQGYGRGGRMKIETDAAQITGGVRHGESLGSPISLWMENKDFRAWDDEMSPYPIENFISKKAVQKPRPGHADLTGGLKYDHRDLRNILERASARETTARVAVGAICRRFIKELGIEVTGHVIRIGNQVIGSDRPSFDEIEKLQENDPCRCIDKNISEKMCEQIDIAKKNGDTLGGVFEVIIQGLPPGLGTHVQWDRKLDAKMAATILSIQAIKGVEFGLGFGVAERFGSEVHDGITYSNADHAFGRVRNHAGGIEGGMTNGMPLVVRGAMKPISTLYKPLASVDIETKKAFEASVERSDACAVPAALVIAENCLCFDIAGAVLEKFGGDSLVEVRRNMEGYLQYVKNY